jgi:tripartite-type tricarboxylate transporter receptor subunit TctC
MPIRPSNAAAFAITTFMACCAPVAAEPLKNVEINIANSVGGGYDQYGRAIARYLSRHLPGQPSVVVKNMPGAGGVRAANFIASAAAPRDGSVLALLTREAALAPLLAPKQASYQFKAQELNWIGSPLQDVGLFVLNSSAPAQSLEDMKTRTVILAGTGPGSGPSTFPLVMNEVLGLKLKVVAGYPGSQEALLAVEKGEADGHVSGGSSAAFRNRVNPLIGEKKLKILLQLGMVKDAEYPDVPLIFELVKDQRARELLGLVFAPQYLGRPIVAPPGVPATRVAELRAAFDAVLKDPEFIEDARRQRMDINRVGGDELARLIDKVYSLPPELIAQAVALSQ